MTTTSNLTLISSCIICFMLLRRSALRDITPLEIQMKFVWQSWRNGETLIPFAIRRLCTMKLRYCRRRKDSFRFGENVDSHPLSVYDTFSLTLLLMNW